MAEIAEWAEHRYRVRSAAPVTPVIRELWLEPADAAIGYRPGQYVLLSDAAAAVPQRSYSIATAPRPDGRINLLVTLVDGGPTSSWAHRLARDDEVMIEGPFGTFGTDPGRTGPVLLLAAGAGLAPLRAVAEALLDPVSATVATSRPVTLFFSGRTERDVINRDLFERWAADYPQFRYLVTTTRQAAGGRHTRIPAALPVEFGSLRGVEVLACGPPGFVAGCEAAARALGATDIRTEEFFADPAPWTGLPPIPATATSAAHQEVP